MAGPAGADRITGREKSMKLSFKNQIENREITVFQEPDFEVRIAPLRHTVSPRATTKSLRKVHSPVSRETVMQAAALLREMALAMPGTTSRAQANITRERARTLLDIEV